MIDRQAAHVAAWPHHHPKDLIMGILAKRSISSGAAGAAAAQGLSDTRKAPAMCRGYATGSVTLVAGTKAVTAAGVPAGSTLHFSMVTPGGTLGVAYQATGIGTNGGFTVTSLQTTTAGQTADTSTLTWEATWPLYHANQTPLLMSADPSRPTASALTSAAATATSLPTVITLANQLLSILLMHGADSVSHVAADSTLGTALAALVVAVDLASSETLLNGLKAALNAHLTQSGVHVFNDTINTVSASAATDLTSSETLANALQTSVNAHFASAPAGESVTVISP